TVHTHTHTQCSEYTLHCTHTQCSEYTLIRTHTHTHLYVHTYTYTLILTHTLIHTVLPLYICFRHMLTCHPVCMLPTHARPPLHTHTHTHTHMLKYTIYKKNVI